MWRQPVLRSIGLVTAVLNLGLNAALTTVIYSYGAAGVSPGRLGLVTLALGLGMLVGSLIAGTLVDRLPTGAVAAGGLAWLVATVAALPWLPGFWPTLVVLGLGTVAAPAVNAGILGCCTSRPARSSGASPAPSSCSPRGRSRSRRSSQGSGWPSWACDRRCWSVPGCAWWRSPWWSPAPPSAGSPVPRSGATCRRDPPAVTRQTPHHPCTHPTTGVC